MIRPLAALTRQVQDFFHGHLVGIYRWEDAVFLPRERNEKPPPETWPRTKRGRRVRPEGLEGRWHHVLRLSFGPYDLEVTGPAEHPPLGNVVLFDGAARTDDDTVEGPLDPATWEKIAGRIKTDHAERQHHVAQQL